MKKWFCFFAAGMAIGVWIAFNNEEGLEDAYYKACRCKKKMIRKLHQMDLDR